jgi:ATP-dependent Clp protease ATP-binding subunit ClpA
MTLSDFHRMETTAGRTAAEWAAGENQAFIDTPIEMLGVVGGGIVLIGLAGFLLLFFLGAVIKLFEMVKHHLAAAIRMVWITALGLLAPPLVVAFVQRTRAVYRANEGQPGYLRAFGTARAMIAPAYHRCSRRYCQFAALRLLFAGLLLFGLLFVVTSSAGLPMPPEWLANPWTMALLLTPLHLARPDGFLPFGWLATPADAVQPVAVVAAEPLQPSVANPPTSTAPEPAEPPLVPVGYLRVGDRVVPDPEHLANRVKQSIFGQDASIELVASKLSARMASPRQRGPVATFLMAGPTGTGKTETARRFAEALNYPLYIVRCNEFNGEHATDRLLGFHASYRNATEESGELSRILNEHHYGVLVLDELEKADPSVSRVLMTLLDEGTVTRAFDGWVINATNWVIFATTNAAHEAIAAATEQAKSALDLRVSVKAALNDIWPPEVLARFDGILAFRRLANTKETIGRLARKEVADIERGLRNVRIVWAEGSDDAILAANAQLGRLGTRELAKHLEDMVTATLAGRHLRAPKQSFTVELYAAEGNELKAWVVGDKANRPAAAGGPGKPVEPPPAPVGYLRVGDRVVPDPEHLANRVKQSVFGQDASIEQIAGKIADRMTAPRQRGPVATFLMAGPTGTGKTETARRFAEALGCPLHFVRCNEFIDEHATDRLLGFNASYRNSTAESGELVRELQKHRRGVLVLDELEKADPSVSRVLMTLLDEGTVTRAFDGTVIDASGWIIFATTNAAHEAVAQATEEAGSTLDLRVAVKAALGNTWPPEVLARFDGIFAFRRLANSRETIGRLARKEVADLERGFLNVRVQWAEGADDAILAANARLGRLGTRELAKHLEDMVSGALAGQHLRDPKRTFTVELYAAKGNELQARVLT